MRAVVCRQFGGPEVLAVEDVPSPALGPGQLRIRVRAAGVNFADSLLVSGNYQVKPPFPFSPGLEAAGEIMELGEGVSGFALGQRVVAVLGVGAFAEEAVAPAAAVHPIPDAMSFTDAAAFVVAYGTSHLGLKSRAGLKPGEFLLVTGAAGGVGLTAVEVGARLGATVIAAAGGADKLEVARRAGATHLIDYRGESVAGRVKEITGGRGANVVYDPVGGKGFDDLLRATAQGGRILIVGFAAGEVPKIPANLLLVKNISAIGYYWGAYQSLDPVAFRASTEELLAWYAAGKLKPHVSHILPMDKAGEAIALLTGRKSTGKVVISM